MKRLMKNVVRRGCCAFTLIEVVTALAVVTLGVVAVLGLIPVSLKSARDAADNTLAATIAQDCFSQMRRLALVTGAWPPAGWPALPHTYWYDAAGTNQVAGVSPDRYFQIQVTSPSPLPSAPPNLQIIAATVTWPAKSANPPNTNVFVTEIAQYQ
jgi:uncharacterized protein (TIGR02598 family)